MVAPTPYEQHRALLGRQGTECCPKGNDSEGGMALPSAFSKREAENAWKAVLTSFPHPKNVWQQLWNWLSFCYNLSTEVHWSEICHGYELGECPHHWVTR